MKPVFYKKLVPLAMIASMAMSNLSVVADAIDAQPAAPEVTVAEETTVDEIIDEEEIEVPDVVLPDVQDYAEGDEDNKQDETSPTEAPAEPTTEATTTTEKIDKNPKIAADTKNAITVNPFDIFDVDDSTTTATLTFTYTKSQIGELDPAKVEITNSSKKAVAGVTIVKKSETENEVAVVHSDEDGSGTVTVKVNIAKKVKATKLYLCYDKKVVSSTGAEYKPSETYDAHNTVVENGALSYEGIGVDLDYTKLPDSVSSVKGAASVAEKGFAGKESIKTINFGKITGLTSVGKSAFEDCTNLRKVVIPAINSTFSGFESKAFKGCTSLSLIDMSNVSCTLTFAADAFEGCKQNIVVLVKGAASMADNAEKPDNVTFINTKSIPNKTSLSMDASTADKDVIQIEPNSGVVLQGNEVIGKLAYGAEGTGTKPTDVNLSSIKWTVKGGTAKFAKVDKEGQLALKETTVGEEKKLSKQFTAASVTGTEDIYISGTKSGGKVNKTITVEGTYKDGKDTKPYGTFTLYVNPAPVTEFKDVKLVDNSGKKTFKVTKAEISEQTNDDVSASAVYDVEMWEGAAYAPAVAAKDGDDKTIYYEVDNNSAAGAIKVVNGKITALAAGEATVYAKPLNGDAFVKFNVKVNSYLKKIRANTTSLALVPGAKFAQEVTISSATSTGDNATYKVAFPTGVTVEANDSTVSTSGYDVVTTDGVLKLSVKLQADKTLAKTDKITVTTADGGKVDIKLTQKTAPENVKKFTEKTKLDKATGARIVNVPVGGTANLNLSVTPATAQSGFEWYFADEELSNNEIVDIIGDVVVAKKVGTVNVYAQSTGLASNCEPICSSNYVINVYNPATPIVLPYESSDSEEDVVVKGGFLMTAKDAKTGTSKKVEGGKTYTLTVPDMGEDVVWTVNNPAGAFVNVNENNKMSITVLAKGTYTITGTSAITKQKYSFKVAADALTTSTPGAVDLYYKTSGAADAYTKATNNSNTPEEVPIGTKLQFAANTEGACYDKTAGNITFASSDPTVATVNAKGLVTVKKAGTTKISATIGSAKSVEFTINATAATSAVKLTVPTYGAADASVKLAAKGITVKKWYYTTDCKTFTELTADGNKFKLPEDEGKYTIVATTTDDDAAVESAVEAGYTSTINVYNVVATKVTALDPHQEWEKSEGSYTLKNPTEKFASLKDLSNAKIGIEAGKKIVIPISATGLKAVDDKGTKKTVTASKIDDSNGSCEITWESSNVYLAKVVNTDASVNYPYANAYVEVVDSGYTGKVTLTGTLNNSGKKVKITLNVVAPKAPAQSENQGS